MDAGVLPELFCQRLPESRGYAENDKVRGCFRRYGGPCGKGSGKGVQEFFYAFEWGVIGDAEKNRRVRRYAESGSQSFGLDLCNKAAVGDAVRHKKQAAGRYPETA
jgi:hypothetical protein